MNNQRFIQVCVAGLLIGTILIQSNPVVASTSSPIFDLTLELDGTDDYASAPDHTSLDLGTAGDFTIEGFFFVSDPDRDDNDVIVWKDGAYRLSIIYSSSIPDRILFIINISATETRQVFYNLEISSGWHHVAVIYDALYTANEYLLSIFLDGSWVSSFSYTGTVNIPNSINPVMIGAQGDTNPMPAWLEEVRFSNNVRYPYGSYVVPTGPFTPDEHTLALWHFDEVWDATLFQDASENGNTLTGVNGAHIGSPTGVIPPPLAFSKVNPVNQAELVSTTPELSWESSVGATGYQLCIESDENDICDGDWIDAGLNTSFIPPKLDIYTQYQWQVRASNLVSTTVADDGQWWSFRTEDAPQSGPEYIVTNTEDELDFLCGIKHCTLREAVFASELDDEASIIELQAGELYTLSSATADTLYGQSALPVIHEALTLQAYGAVIERDPTLLCNPNNAEDISEFRLLQIASTGEMNINQVTLRYGCSDGNLASIPEAGLGGAIYNQGILTLDQTTLANNHAYQGGGAIYNDLNAILRINNSTIVGNIATLGGGGFMNAGNTSLTNSTLTENNTSGDGGGLNNISNGITTLNFVTITENFAGLNGGGIANLSGGSVEKENSLLGNNSDVDSSAPDCSGNIDSLGYNLVEEVAGCDFTAQASDILKADPLLLPLANNGGATLTHALFTLSPAIDRIPFGENGCGTTIQADQRGIERPLDAEGDGEAACDIGSFELSEGSTVLYYTFLAIILNGP